MELAIGHAFVRKKHFGRARDMSTIRSVLLAGRTDGPACMFESLVCVCVCVRGSR